VTRIRRRYVIALLVLATAAIGFVTRQTWLPGVGRWLDVGEPPVPADYAFVAAGDEQSRPFAAALLYKYGYVRKILLTRPPRHAGSARVSKEYDELSRAVLVHQGVKPDDIRVLEGDVYSTMDEARLLAPLVRAEPQARFVVVTSDYHTRRTLWSVRHVTPEGADRLHAFAAPTDGVVPAEWWNTENGAATYLSEYLRLAFYHLRYGSAGWWIAFVVAAIVGAAVARRYLFRDLRTRRGGGLGRNSSTSAT
jgi:uncharacterized SAM-binding protein YcdF (DUF218 family)